MFGIGLTEFLLIGCVAILIIGPDEMPSALRSLGKMFAKFQKFSGEFQKGLQGLAEDADLDGIVDEANMAGDAMMDFRIEQQQLLEKRAIKEKRAKKKKNKTKTKTKTIEKKTSAKKTLKKQIVKPKTKAVKKRKTIKNSVPKSKKALKSIKKRNANV